MNLFDATDLPAAEPVKAEQGLEERYRAARAPDGSYNDLRRPMTGMQKSRFGRNVALSPYGGTHTILEPNPREVSDVLMARREDQHGEELMVPFKGGNALLAAWIQFMIRDWFNHGSGVQPCWQLPRPGTSPPDDPELLEVMRTRPDPTLSLVDKPVTHVNELSHWWDGSQIYPADEDLRARTRCDHGRIREDLHTVLFEPSDSGFWVGLAMMIRLFAKEHNAICERLHQRYSWLGDDELYDKARLVNTALMAKIHTVDWTAAALAHKTTVWGTRIEWWGLLGERMFKKFGRVTRRELLSGIPGCPTKDFGVPFSLTEEFIAVYRMHQMLPNQLTLLSVDGSPACRTLRLPELLGESGLALLANSTEADLVYSFARAPAGAVTLHNYPRDLRRMPRTTSNSDTTFMQDLAAIDILRCREMGVPRYNELRRALHMKSLKHIDDITTDERWRSEIRSVYGDDVEAVDLLVGLCAEERPDGFAFSDTAFRVFLLMAPRRLLSDRFFTTDYRADVYTPAGIEWIEENRMATVIKRHVRECERLLGDGDNAFCVWPTDTASNP